MCTCRQQNDEVTLSVTEDGMLCIVDTETGNTFGYVKIDFCPMCGQVLPLEEPKDSTTYFMTRMTQEE
jgi:hypothetical protein